MVDGPRLTASELAARTESSPEHIHDLAGIGVLRPGTDGTFSVADAQRVHVAAAYERAGIELELLGRAIRDGHMSFDFTDRIYPAPSPPSGLTVGDLMTELGAAGTALPDVLLAMGLAQPTSERPLTDADVASIRLFMRAWTSEPLAVDAALRAARIAGDTTRRLAEGWTDLFVEAVALPPEATATMTLDALGPRLFEPGIRVAEAVEPTVLWLLRRHLEQALNVVNVAAMEAALEVEGLRERTDREPASIVFADISGFTRLTEEHGDEQAVRQAEGLAHLAANVAAAHDGRLVKQLGDGVMLAFERASSAVPAARALLAAATRARQLPLHVGISAGPVIERDGDYYGRTVILASRLSGVAGPGEIVLDAVAARFTTESLAELPATPLKGLPAPVSLFRISGG